MRSLGLRGGGTPLLPWAGGLLNPVPRSASLFLSSCCVSTFLLAFGNSGTAGAEIKCGLQSRIDAMKVRSFCLLS